MYLESQPIIHSAAELAPNAEDCEGECHDFCPCCLFTKSLDAFTDQLKSREFVGVRLYASRCAQFDIKRFHETNPGGLSSAYGALSNQVGEEVNPAIVRAPQALVAVLKRIDAWDVSPADKYDPGWDVQGRAKMSASEEAVLSKSIKDEALNHLRPMSALLSDPEYFSAFMIFQAFNLASWNEQKDPGRIAEKTAAEETLLKIEKERNLSYLTGMLNSRRK